MDREHGIALLGAASARALHHWAPGQELMRPSPSKHLALRLGTNSRNLRLLAHADQVGPRIGAGTAWGSWPGVEWLGCLPCKQRVGACAAAT